MAAPLGIVNEYAPHKPTSTDNSEKIIEIITVDLYDHPILIPAATGMTIIDDINNTPAASNNTETTIDSIIMKIIWNTPTLIPKYFAFISSKLTAIIFLPNIMKSIETMNRVIRIK